MLGNLTIKSKLLMLAFLTIVGIALIVSIESIYSIKEFSKKNVEKYKKEAYEKKRGRTQKLCIISYENS